MDSFISENLSAELMFFFSCCTHRMQSKDTAVAICVLPEEVVTGTNQVPQRLFVKLAIRALQTLDAHFSQVGNLDM